jgi:YVTN family beta-propeller protein
MTMLQTLLTAALAMAAAEGPHYAVVERIAGRDGGYDYLTVDSERQRLYAAREYGVMALDLATKKVTNTLVPANDVSAVVIIPGTSLMLSTEYGSDNVVLFDRFTGVVKTRIRAGKKPDAAVYDFHSGLAFVMNADSNDVTVIDVKAAKAVATVPMGGKPEGGAVDDQGHVFINIEDTTEIVVVDVAARKVTRRFKLPGCVEPTGIAYDAVTATLISVCHNGVAKIIDARNGADRGSVKIGLDADGAIFDSTRRLAFVPCKDGTLTVFRLDKSAVASVVDVVDTQRGARTAALDPASGRLYLSVATLGTDDEPLPGTFRILVLAPAVPAKY